MASLRVLIADSQLLMRNGLKQVLTEEYRDVVFGEARTADEVLNQVSDQPWDLVILDIGIPGKDGFQVLGETLLQRPGTRVLMLNMHAYPRYADRARQLGAFGYICKDAIRAELVKSFRNVLAGKVHFDASPPTISVAPTTSGHQMLSAREYVVLLGVAAGKQASQIAAELSVNAKTVSTYKSRILNKLHLKSTADLVHYVIDHRLV